MNPERDERLGAALSEVPVPDHGPDFWNRLDERITAVADPAALAGRAAAGQDLTETPAAEPVSLDERRERRVARRGGRPGRSLLAAAAAVAVVVAAAGAVTVVRRGDHHQVNAAGRSPGTKPAPSPGTTAPPPAPAEFSATYAGIDGPRGSAGSTGSAAGLYRLTVARDGSYRWTSSDGGDDMAFDASTSRHVEIVTRGEGASKQHPNAFVSTGVPVGGPFQGVTNPDPLSPIRDFVIALARANDSRITATTVAGRPAWHYDGPIVQDRLGGDRAPNHAVADVDQASGVLLQLTRRVGDQVVTRFTASDVTVADRVDRSRYQLTPPPGSKTTPVAIGYTPKTLDEAAAGLPYDLLVPAWVPDGFTLGSVNSVAVARDAASPTGPEGVNAPTNPVVNMTWRRGAQTFTVTLRPSEGHPDWNDPLGQEGLVLDARTVRLALDGRPPLEGQVAVDPPVEPHVWGVTGDIVVTVSGDLARADLERVAGSLRPHRAG
jgi:hypothetical protein